MPMSVCVRSTPPIVYVVLVMLVCGGSTTCRRVCCGVVIVARNLRRRSGRQLGKGATVDAARAGLLGGRAQAAALAALAARATALLGTAARAELDPLRLQAGLHLLELGLRWAAGSGGRPAPAVRRP